MRRRTSRLAAACVLAAATMVFAGGALAGNGNGNGNANGNESAPGQQKQEQAQPAAPAAQPAQPQPDQAATHSVSTSADTSPGVKPSNSTTKWTHCKTGGTAANAT